MATVVCMLVHGDAGYYRASGEAARSVLRSTPFRLFVAHGDEAAPPLAASSRVALHALADPFPTTRAQRAQRFLRKFRALEACLAGGRDDFVVLLDADALFVRPCTERMVAAALADHPIAMVEQPTVTGSRMGRVDFLAHYVRHTLALLAPEAPPPALADFRYFNSGVVLLRRAEAEALTRWAQRTIDDVAGDHEVGEHMIADQDYFQLWVNTLHPGRAANLPWYWNHCEHWHPSFPRLGTLIAHFSNFCHGPAATTPTRMRALQRGSWRWLNRAAGAWIDGRRRAA